jgi:hypothetical protein
MRNCTAPLSYACRLLMRWRTLDSGRASYSEAPPVRRGEALPLELSEGSPATA